MAIQTRPDVEVAADPAAAARASARRIVASARAALSARDKFTLALAGGSTPLSTYEVLARDCARDVDWGRVDFFVGDERLVPHDDRRSNFGAARRAWLAGLGLAPAALHPMPLGPDDTAGARDYERELRERAPEGLDFVMLGLGDDGHTASLFPGRIDALPPACWVVAAKAPPSSPVERRMTLTFAAFEAAREVVFQVCGANKARLVADVLAGRGGHPAGRVRARERLSWILDEAAAREWRAERASGPTAS